MNTDRVVVDTSLAIKWAVKESDSPSALALLDEWTQHGVLVLAPALIAYEVANALHQQVRKGLLTAGVEVALLARFHSLGVEIEYPDNPTSVAAMSARAVEIARSLGLGASYDTQFLALAEHEDCEYWTADHRFYETARQDHPRVRWLGAYQPPQPQATGPTPTP